MTDTSPPRPFVKFTRTAAAVAVVAAAIDVALVAAGLPACPCPTAALGFSCPGCGLGRSVAAMFRGDFAAMLRLHAFAPVAVAGLAILAVVAVLPTDASKRFCTVLSRIEDRTRIAVFLGIGLVVYWLVRMALGCGAPISGGAA